MIFKLVPNPTFKSTVDIPVPGADAPAKLVLVFKHMSRKKMSAFFDELFSGENAKALDSETLDPIVSGWEGVKDSENKNVEFGREAFETLLDNYPGASMAILEAYQQAYLKAKEKN